jgi:hypothetical protein
MLIAYKNGVPKARVIRGVPREQLVKVFGGVFEPSYVTLRSFARVGGLESDLRLLAPGEFGANTTELVQMLKKGHHGVSLDAEAWQRITTWIDLNAPCHGTWTEVVGLEKTRNDNMRRLDLRKLYGGTVEDPEIYPEMPERRIEPVEPAPVTNSKVEAPRVPEWPFDSAEAQRRQATAGQTYRTIDLGNGIEIEMVLVPSGHFVIGDKNGYQDERPLTPVNIKQAFWMSKCEVTNEQYAAFDPSHDSKYEHKGSWMFNEWDLGWALNEPRQPVVRVSWKEAVEFCRWLSGNGLAGRAPILHCTTATWTRTSRRSAIWPISPYGISYTT